MKPVHLFGIVLAWAAVGLAGPVHASPAPANSCDLPTDRDLIIWEKYPTLVPASD